jgi:hypothetical protein
MPKVSINKNYDTMLPKRKVRASWKLNVPPPTDKPGMSEDLDKSQLCGTISPRLDAPHDFRPFGARKNVSHNEHFFKFNTMTRYTGLMENTICKSDDLKWRQR